MKQTVQSSITGKKYFITQNAWSGKYTITIDGIAAQRVEKREFTYTENDQTSKVKLVGNGFTELYLIDGETRIVVLAKLKWYEIVFAVLPLTLVFLGGAIGGALGGLSAVLIVAFIRKVKNVFLQLVTALAITGVAYLLYFIIADAILQAI